MRCEAERVVGIFATHDEHRLSHVERNEREPIGVVGVVGPRRSRPLAVIEQAIRTPEDEIVLVPESIPVRPRSPAGRRPRSEEHTSELQSLMRISYAVFCLKKKITDITTH